MSKIVLYGTLILSFQSLLNSKIYPFQTLKSFIKSKSLEAKYHLKIIRNTVIA